MTRLLLLSVGLVFSLLASTPNANATDSALDESIQGLVQNCRSVATARAGLDPDANYCLGYISGIGDYMKGLGLSGNASMGICGNVTYGASVQAFMNWANAHPERWTENRLVGVATALRQTWPCKKSN
jgi:hypothetical protein